MNCLCSCCRFAVVDFRRFIRFVDLRISSVEPMQSLITSGYLITHFILKCVIKNSDECQVHVQCTSYLKYIEKMTDELVRRELHKHATFDFGETFLEEAQIKPFDVERNWEMNHSDLKVYMVVLTKLTEHATRYTEHQQRNTMDRLIVINSFKWACDNDPVGRAHQQSAVCLPSRRSR